MKDATQQVLETPRERGVTMRSLAGSRISLLAASFLALCTSCAEKPSNTVATKDPVNATARETTPQPRKETPGERHVSYMRSLREHVYGGEVSMGGKFDEGGRTAIMKAEYEFHWSSAQQDIAKGEPTKALCHLGHTTLFTFAQADTVSHPAFRKDLEEKFQRARAEIVRVYKTLPEKDRELWKDNITSYTQSEHIPIFGVQKNPATASEQVQPGIPGKAHCEKDHWRLEDEEGGGGPA